MVDWLRIGADMEEVATQALQGGKRLGGLLRPMIVQPYRGFVADGVAHVRARVLEEPRFRAGADGLSIDATIYANLLRWVVLDVPDVEVTVSMGDVSVVTRSNKDGFVIAKLPVGDVGPGWHAVQFCARDGDRVVTANGRVVRPDPASGTAVITDIDDTLLQTGMTEGLKSIQRTLLRDAHGRRPVPGTPSLCRGLARGTGGRPESTFFYVSSAPWNLYDMLVQFLQLRGFPRGPLFLTDWRPARREIVRPRENPSHKRARIRRLIDGYPELTFVLLGDDGEHDQEIYQEFLESDPDRFELALIREVRSRAADPTDAASPAQDGDGHVVGQRSGQESGRGVVTCADTSEMAAVALRAHLVDDLVLEEVQTELTARF